MTDQVSKPEPQPWMREAIKELQQRVTQVAMGVMMGEPHPLHDADIEQILAKHYAASQPSVLAEIVWCVFTVDSDARHLQAVLRSEDEAKSYIVAAKKRDAENRWLDSYDIEEWKVQPLEPSVPATETAKGNIHARLEHGGAMDSNANGAGAEQQTNDSGAAQEDVGSSADFITALGKYAPDIAWGGEAGRYVEAIIANIADQLIPDGLNRSLAERVRLLLERADREASLAVKLRNEVEKLQAGVPISQGTPPQDVNDDILNRLIETQRLEFIRLREGLEKIAAEPLGSHAVKRIAEELLSSISKLAASSQGTGWVSVEERLPEERTWVQGLLEHDGKLHVSPLYGVKRNDGTFQWESEFIVRAWQPLASIPLALPTPPSKEKT